MNMVINIESYGDFDIPSTEVIMIAPAGYDRAAVKKIAKEVQRNNSNTRDVDIAIKELKSFGFSVCTDISLKIGGAL